jgi:hypothetical protein
MPPYLTIIIAVAGIILTGAGILVNKIWRDSETNNHNFQESLLQLNDRSYDIHTKLTHEITKLGSAVSGLTATVIEQGKGHDDFKESCQLTKASVNQRLNSHGETLKKHGIEIEVIKEKIKK